MSTNDKDAPAAIFLGGNLFVNCTFDGGTPWAFGPGAAGEVAFASITDYIAWQETPAFEEWCTQTGRVAAVEREWARSRQEGSYIVGRSIKT